MPETPAQTNARRLEPRSGAALRSVGIAFTGMLLMLGFAVYTVAAESPAAPTLAAAPATSGPASERPLWAPPLAVLVR